jgi:deoxycytidylate deaminase
MPSKWEILAKKVASKSKHKYHMGAVVVRGGNILATACNGPNRGSHAEKKALGYGQNFEGATIVISNLDGIRCSRPCLDCFRLIRGRGIKYMHFTEDGVLVRKTVAIESEEDYRSYGLSNKPGTKEKE